MVIADRLVHETRHGPPLPGWQLTRLQYCTLCAYAFDTFVNSDEIIAFATRRPYNMCTTIVLRGVLRGRERKGFYANLIAPVSSIAAVRSGID